MKRIGCLIGALFLLLTTNAESDQTTILLDQANAVKRTHTDSAISLTHKALALASTDSLKARAYYTLGNTYLIHDQYEKSLSYYREIFPFLEIDTILRAKVYNNMGVAYKCMAQYDSSITYYFKSLSLKKGEMKASTLYNIGYIYNIMGNYDKAIDYYNDSKQLYITYNDTSGLAEITNEMGSVYLEREEYKKALNYFFEYLSLIPSLHLVNKGIAYGNIGLTYERMNQLDSAYIYTSQALTISREIDDRVSIMINLLNSGYILQRQEKYMKALSLFEQSSLIADSLNRADELKDIYFNMSEIYGALHKDKEELMYYKRFDSIREKINSQNIQRVVEQEKAKYTQLELQQTQEIAALQLSLTTRKERIAKFVFYGVVIFSIVLGVFMVLMLRLRRRKIENEYQRQVAFLMLEAEEKTKEEISDKLYNEVGAINTLTKYALIPFKQLSEKDYNDIIELVNQASKTSREISYRLSSMDLKMFGLGDAIRTCFEYLNKRYEHIQFEYQTNINQGNRLPYPHEVHFFRIIQELITNTLKHGNASKATLIVKRTKTEKINLYYKDNGAGFDVKKTKKGLGLKSIESRAAAMNLKVKIKSTKGEGVEVILNPCVSYFGWTLT